MSYELELIDVFEICGDLFPKATVAIETKENGFCSWRTHVHMNNHLILTTPSVHTWQEAEEAHAHCKEFFSSSQSFEQCVGETTLAISPKHGE